MTRGYAWFETLVEWHLQGQMRDFRVETTEKGMRVVLTEGAISVTAHAVGGLALEHPGLMRGILKRQFFELGRLVRLQAEIHQAEIEAEDADAEIAAGGGR